MHSTFLHCLFIFCTAVEFLQGAFCLPLFFLTLTGAISSITPLTFELKESRRKSTESADMLGVKDIAFINSTLVFSFKHLFLTDTDLASMAGRDQYIKENTEMIRQCYILNNN